MKIDIVANPSGPHQVTAAHWLARGLGRHGLHCRVISNQQAPTADIVACWGWRLGRQLHAAGRTVLVMERGYIGDRFAWTSLGWDGLNGRARFPIVDDRGTRLRAVLPDILKPESCSGDYVLVMGQVTGDAALTGVDIGRWYRRAARKFEGERVCFRPHPVELRRARSRFPTEFFGMEVIGGDLDAALARAQCVVAYNSNSLTDALMAGVPCVAGDEGAMSWPVAGQGLAAEPSLSGRERWAGHMAWCQWSRDEIESGVAWEAVRSAMNRKLPAFCEAL